ncbi:MAG: LuxR C-terminal-related transcriptional regulator [Parafannyhessea sp.]|uniref:helix-turn-helix transcriptional regulator n=1 Tax=Parafannyhessea sp. TaxID=2847324 RepID=UPI003EFF3352
MQNTGAQSAGTQGAGARDGAVPGAGEHAARRRMFGRRDLWALAAALAFFWPSVHHEVMFPVTIIYRHAESAFPFPLHVLYLVLVLAVAVAVAVGMRRAVPRPSWAYACGLLGGAGGFLILRVTFDQSLPQALAAGVAIACFAAYVGGFFVLVFAQLSRLEPRPALVAVLVSYAAFCLLRLVECSTGLRVPAGVALFPLVSGVLLARVRGDALQPDAVPSEAARADSPQPGETPRPAPFACFLPWPLIGACVAFIYLAVMGTIAFNLQASWAELPSSRVYIYLFNGIACALALVLCALVRDARLLMPCVFSLFALYFVAAIAVSLFLSSDTFNFGSSPLIGVKLAFGVLLLVVCAKACNPRRRHAAPVGVMAVGWLGAAFAVPEFVSSYQLMAERCAGALPGFAEVFLVAAGASLAVMTVLVVFLLVQLMRAHGSADRRIEARDSADQQGFEDRIQRELGLTPREAQITYLLCRGNNAKAIAKLAFISESTVYTTMKRMYRKLGIHSKQELVDLVIARVGRVG